MLPRNCQHGRLQVVSGMKLCKTIYTNLRGATIIGLCQSLRAKIDNQLLSQRRPSTKLDGGMRAEAPTESG
jgi:hypothetical protein